MPARQAFDGGRASAGGARRGGVVYVEVRNEDLDPWLRGSCCEARRSRPPPEGDPRPAPAYLEAAGRDGVDRQPWIVAAILPQLDYLADMAVRETMDKLVYGIAQRTGREVGGLESLDEQLGLFEALTKEQQAKMLDSTLATLEKDAKEGKEGKGAMAALIDAFLRGDAEAVRKAVEDAESAGDEDVKKFLDNLLYRRNEIMVERLLERTKAMADKTIFVAVGAAHYPGERGMLELLAKKGWKTRRVALDEKIPPRKEPAAPAAARPDPTEPVPAK
jgi:hypothetical protein